MTPFSYALPVSDRELSVAEAAEYLHLSEDTVRAMIRAGVLPALQRYRRGPYMIKEADVRTVAEKRAAGAAAGAADIDPAELAVLVAHEMRHRAYRAQAAAEKLRRDRQARILRASSGQGYGAVTEMADAVGLHRTVVQRWLIGHDDPDKRALLERELREAEEAEREAIEAAERAEREADRLLAERGH